MKDLRLLAGILMLSTGSGFAQSSSSGESPVDVSKRSKLEQKEFKLDFEKEKGGRATIETKRYIYENKMFSDRKSSVFSKKMSPGFSKEVPTFAAPYGRDLKFSDLSSGSGLKKDQEFYKAQDRYVASKKAPYSVTQRAPEASKWSRLNGKVYQGREVNLVKPEISETKKKELQQLAKDSDGTLSVEKIREILNKN